ncbi:unnamed protein product [Urochloa humidicola]
MYRVAASLNSRVRRAGSNAIQIGGRLARSSSDISMKQGLRVDLTDGNTISMKLTVMEDDAIGKGYISQYFITNQKNQKFDGAKCDENKDRVLEAVHGKAAMGEGITPGGGCALFHSSCIMDKLQSANFENSVQIIHNDKNPVHGIPSDAAMQGAVTNNLLGQENTDTVKGKSCACVLTNAILTEVGKRGAAKILRNMIPPHRIASDAIIQQAVIASKFLGKENTDIDEGRIQS